MSMKLAAKGKGGKDEHEGGGARKCMHGYVCQLNLCALNFLRAYRCGYTFQLGSEDIKIKDYDDMILKYKGEDGRETELYLQSKHIQNSDNKSLTASHLLVGETENRWKDERFLLSKYYESYLKNKISSKEHYFIIYTNMGLDIEDLSKAGINVVQSPENTSRFFQIDSNGNNNCYNLSVDENHHLIEQFYTLSDAYKVAKELVERIKDQSEKPLEMKNYVLQKYKHFLGFKVLVGNADDERKRQFADEFISGETLPSKFKTFRNIFKKLYYGAIKPNYEFENEAAFQEDLRKKRVKVSRSFLELDEEKITEFPDPSECIKGFFNEFVLAVKQPNVTELEEIIKNEIEEIFTIKDTELIVPVIKSNMLDWMKKKTGTWLTRDDAESFIQGIKQNMETIMIRGISLDYQNELNRMNCIIKSEELEGDITVKAIIDFLQGEREIMLIGSKQSLLSLLKVHQGIMWMKVRYGFKSLEKDDDLLFLPFVFLASSESVRNDLNNKNTFNLLVSHVQERDLNEVGCQECLKSLLNLVVSKKRKMILVFEEVVSDTINSIITDIGCEQRLFNNSEIIFDKSLSFFQLDENAQNHLLQLEVVDFQGKLTNLLSFSSEVKNIIDAETLLCLIQKAHIHVGKLGQESGYTDPYIPRQLSLDDSPSEASNKVAVPPCISEDDLLSVNEFGKVLIISGGPRTGKSWLVSSLSEKLKMTYPSMWVLKIDLNNYAEIFNEIALCTILKEQYSYSEDTDKTIKFIIEKLLGDPSHAMISSEFEKEILKLGFIGEMKLSLLIDGFSELCKDSARFVMQLLMGMQKTQIEMLLITTRPEHNHHLECLQGKYFSLDSFACNKNLNVVRLNSVIKLPPNLGDLNESKVGEFLSSHCKRNNIEGYLNKVLGKDGDELWEKCQDRLVSGVERLLEKEIYRATDGNYRSASSTQSIINGISGIIKKRLDVTTRFQ